VERSSPCGELNLAKQLHGERNVNKTLFLR